MQTALALRTLSFDYEYQRCDARHIHTELQENNRGALSQDRCRPSVQAGDGPRGSASWKTKDLVAPAGSVARPRRVTPCAREPPVRRDAGVGAVLTHEV
jgi:hypothetical protein